ncbi:FtsX-like permease family protein [Nonomuraea coxensis DSM 45129]|uniref:FtsX-like permease family protein n=1 Tax=Nonomuraea coxensis DSM 45129 TaxID=1122611 RepID=A0ABX8U942_9ACTN|nr:FtsX-like permease family protein [Nonomuraea coxensis]QYC44253.1 FtsX-like permease family protein [Nonomuraea coxensis DSM 45129]
MLRLVARRVRAQWPLLAALLAVAVVGPTLLGACALLLTRTAEQALETAASRATHDQVGVTAYTVTVRGEHARSVADDTRAVLTSALAPFTATTAARASSVMRSLPGAGVPAVAYLSGVEDLPARTQLAAGRLPRAGATPAEAVVLESTARRLGLSAGSRVRLGRELADDPDQGAEVSVVGVVRPLPGAGWERDPLAAAGYDPAYRDGRSAQPVHAYGPFIVDLSDLLAGGSTLDRLEISAHPDLSAPAVRDLDTVTQAVLGADRRLGRTLGDRVRIQRVASRLPSTLLAAHDQQRVTTAAVLAVAAIGLVLTATALALAGRLSAGVRGDETALLSALGVGRGQLAGAALAEAGALAVLATAVAIPASSALHAALTRLPPMSGAGLAAPFGVNAVQVLSVAGGALALAVVLVVPSLRTSSGGVRGRRELLARSGADLLLVAFAAVGWWQLRDQPAGSGSPVDTVRVLAPALLLIAGSALALRLVWPALRVAERLAGRARGLMVPLAAFEAARRPQAVAAGLLIGLGCAAATYGIGFDATWQRSQQDQADLSLGTDLALTLTVPPAAGQGRMVGAAGGGEVSPATDRGVAIGQWLGGAGDPPRLIAVDTTRAEALLRGRLDDGRTWNAVGALLAPPTRAAGVPVPAGAALSLTGNATGPTPLTVTPRLLLQDATGLRTPCTGAPVPLDGTAHPLPDCATAEGLRLVAVSLPFVLATGNVGTGYSDALAEAPEGDSRVAVTLTVAGTVSEASPWTATSAGPAPGQLGDPAVALTSTSAGTKLRMTTTVALKGPPDAARNLVATAFPAPGPVPVAVSARLADEVSARRGSRLDLTVGLTPVQVSVAEVLPAVPSAPGAAAVLADFDALSRALAVNGDFDVPVDAWWVGRPTRGDAADLRLGDVTTRAAEAARLTGGPLRAALPAVLRLLVPAAVLLMIAGIVLHVTFDLRARAVETARLRGLGMTRREIRAVLLGQHVGILLPLLAAGAVVGALATRVVAPLLVRSDTGAAPVPEVLPVWPWAAEAALLTALPAGCALAVTAVVVVQARRADAAHLRVAS